MMSIACFPLSRSMGFVKKIVRRLADLDDVAAEREIIRELGTHWDRMAAVGIDTQTMTREVVALSMAIRRRRQCGSDEVAL